MEVGGAVLPSRAVAASASTPGQSLPSPPLSSSPLLARDSVQGDH